MYSIQKYNFLRFLQVNLQVHPILKWEKDAISAHSINSMRKICFIGLFSVLPYFPVEKSKRPQTFMVHILAEVNFVFKKLSLI